MWPRDSARGVLHSVVPTSGGHCYLKIVLLRRVQLRVRETLCNTVQVLTQEHKFLTNQMTDTSVLRINNRSYPTVRAYKLWKSTLLTCRRFNSYPCRFEDLTGRSNSRFCDLYDWLFCRPG